MKTVALNRFKFCHDGTLGGLELPTNGQVLYSLEPPWQDNEPNVSCIPDGEYTVRRDYTGKHKYYRLVEVPDRSNIEIHPANYYINPYNGKQELHGCIALGLYINHTHPASVSSSRIACNRLLEEMGDDDWALIINSERDDE